MKPTSKKPEPNAWAVNTKHLHTNDRVSVGPVYLQKETDQQWYTPHRELVVDCHAVVSKNGDVRIFSQKAEAALFVISLMERHAQDLGKRMYNVAREVERFRVEMGGADISSNLICVEPPDPDPQDDEERLAGDDP